MTATQMTRPWDTTDSDTVIDSGLYSWDIDGHILTVGQIDDEGYRWGWQAEYPDGSEDESGPDFETWQEAAEAGWQEMQIDWWPLTVAPYEVVS